MPRQQIQLMLPAGEAEDRQGMTQAGVLYLPSGWKAALGPGAGEVTSEHQPSCNLACRGKVFLCPFTREGGV